MGSKSTTLHVRDNGNFVVCCSCTGNIVPSGLPRWMKDEQVRRHAASHGRKRAVYEKARLTPAR